MEAVEQEAPLAVNTREAARLLGVSDRTVFTLTQSGELRHVRIGKRVLYTRAALDEFIKFRELQQ